MFITELRKAVRAKQELEKNNFVVTVSESDVTFSKFSPAGQDFNVIIELDEDDEVEDIASKVKSYYNSFDVSEEAYLWLDETGHGKNGAPYDMRDVYDDMKECEQYIDDIYNILHNIA